VRLKREHLRLVLEPPDGSREQRPVEIPLEFGPRVGSVFGSRPSLVELPDALNREYAVPVHHVTPLLRGCEFTGKWTDAGGQQSA
jgi:hypothetical protein